MALPPVKKSVANYAIPDDAKILINHMERLLDAVVGLYEQQGIPLPARRFWMLGPTAPEDCEQVVVSFIQTYLGVPGDSAAEAQQCNVPCTGVFNVHITRDYPIGTVGKAIPAEQIIEASKWAAIDTNVLIWGLNDLNIAQDGYSGPGVIATVNVAPPSGGVQTTTLNISMTIL